MIQPSYDQNYHGNYSSDSALGSPGVGSVGISVGTDIDEMVDFDRDGPMPDFNGKYRSFNMVSLENAQNLT